MNSVNFVFDYMALADVMKGNISEHARKLGVSKQHLHNILKGRRRPSSDLLLKIQNSYNLSAKRISKLAI